MLTAGFEKFVISLGMLSLPLAVSRTLYGKRLH